MYELEFIEDIATIMVFSGIITVLFHLFKQPLVLGYIFAGFLIGPYTPPFSFIQNEATIHIFSQLGVIFLMFSLGLEFSLRKLANVGASAFIAALLEIIVMIWIGYGIGYLFGWSSINSLFLGSMLAISSTTIIVKALEELGFRNEKFVQLIYAILIIEDILAIAILVVLTGVATKSVGFLDVIATIGTLILFLITSIIIGLLLVPRIIKYIAGFQNQEVLLISVLGFCFGFCLLVIELQYSLVLGAFLMGAIIAEAKPLHTIENLIRPLRDMFSAVFFVTIGLMLNPKILVQYLGPIFIITIAVVVGKVVTCSLGAFITGRDGRTSLRVGMGLAQIGEFSFIIAALGTSLGVIDNFLYPIVVAVSAITTILTPYLIKSADTIAQRMTLTIPKPIASVFHTYTIWLENIQLNKLPDENTQKVKRAAIEVFINLALVATIFLSFSFIGIHLPIHSLTQSISIEAYQTIIWCTALLISLPFLIVIYKKIKKMSIIIAKINMNERSKNKYNEHVRIIISRLIPVLAMLCIMLLLCILSSAILPPTELLIVIFIFTAVIIALLWRWLLKLHASLQSHLLGTLDKKDK